MCSPLHIYNAVLSINSFIEHSDICIFDENEAFNRRLILEGNFRPTLNEINAVHA